jgi:hypothetical protein
MADGFRSLLVLVLAPRMKSWVAANRARYP